VLNPLLPLATSRNQHWKFRCVPMDGARSHAEFEPSCSSDRALRKRSINATKSSNSTFELLARSTPTDRNWHSNNSGRASPNRGVRIYFFSRASRSR
jgi:hypothetical protein